MIRFRNQFCPLIGQSQPILFSDWLKHSTWNIPEILLQIVILMPAVCSICFHTFKHKYGLQSEEDGIEEKVRNYKTMQDKFYSSFKLSDLRLFDHFRKNLMEACQRYQLSKSLTLVNLITIKMSLVWINFLKPNQIKKFLEHSPS